MTFKESGIYTAMDLAKTTFWKYPKTPANTTIIGDSQMKYVHQYFNPHQQGTPAFITQPGARIGDVHFLLDFVPDTTRTLVLHVGTNDLSSASGETAFHKYRSLIDHIRIERPKISRIYVSLILPRSPNRRYGGRNQGFVRRCNSEACKLNGMLRNFCNRSSAVYFIDHGFEWIPAYRVLAADGLHPSFEGSSLIASHIRQLFPRRILDATSSWCDHSTEQPPISPKQNSRSRDRVSTYVRNSKSPNNPAASSQ